MRFSALLAFTAHYRFELRPVAGTNIRAINRSDTAPTTIAKPSGLMGPLSLDYAAHTIPHICAPLRSR